MSDTPIDLPTLEAPTCCQDGACSNCPSGADELLEILPDLVIEAVVQALESLRAIAVEGSNSEAVEASQAILSFVSALC